MNAPHQTSHLTIRQKNLRILGKFSVFMSPARHIVSRGRSDVSYKQQLIHLFVEDSGGRLFVALAELLVLILPSKVQNVLLKDVASLRCISKILYMVEGAGSAGDCGQTRQKLKQMKDLTEA